MSDYDDYTNFEPEELPEDAKEGEAREEIEKFFEENQNKVFFSRQIEVRYEDKYFHWVTNRALRGLREAGVLKSEERKLATGGSIILIWHRSFRYYRRSAAQVVRLVEEYADPNIGAAIGLHGESMVLEGFARSQFLMLARDAKSFEGRAWIRSDHNLDFIFQRDGRVYGVEVKNTLGYMDYGELDTKIKVCEHLEIRPVFVVRMAPKNWVEEVRKRGGFTLVLKYQLYPWSHRDLAKKVARELSLPVDAPRALYDGTMKRFIGWHNRQL
ncbi:MAG: hypothetical protein ACREQ2_27900 [Candidatus Binatia bacterium]